MEKVMINQVYELSTGLKVITFKEQYCWYLCLVIKESNQHVFKVGDIVAISTKYLLQTQNE